MAERPVSLHRRIEALLRRWEEERSKDYAARDDASLPRVLRDAAGRAAEDLTHRIDAVEGLLYVEVVPGDPPPPVTAPSANGQ